MTSSSNLLTESIDNLRRVFQFITDQSKKTEQKIGLTRSQLRAINIIAESGTIKVSDVAHKMNLHPATVVVILDKLELRGLVLRTRSTKDRRVVEIDLTDQGRQIVTKSPEMVNLPLINGLEQLSRSNLRKVSEGLNQLVAILGSGDNRSQLIQSTAHKII